MPSSGIVTEVELQSGATSAGPHRRRVLGTNGALPATSPSRTSIVCAVLNGPDEVSSSAVGGTFGAGFTTTEIVAVLVCGLSVASSVTW